MPRKVIQIVQNIYHIIGFSIAIQRSCIFEMCIIFIIMTPNVFEK